jgi:hypothetical protein
MLGTVTRTTRLVISQAASASKLGASLHPLIQHRQPLPFITANHGLIGTAMFAPLLTLLCGSFLVRASTVYMHPPLPNHAATHGASAIIAHHLRLERFEPMNDGQIASFAEPFVGEGEVEGLVLSIEESYVKGACYVPGSGYQRRYPSGGREAYTSAAFRVYCYT